VILFVDTDCGRPLSTQLYDQLRAAILDGRLKPGDRLLATRSVAVELGVSRSTVTAVYGRLSAEGYLEGRAGGGSVVAAYPAALHPRPGPGALAPHSRLADLRPFDTDPTAAMRYDLRPGRTDPALFPSVAWRRCVRAAADAGSDNYGDPAGSADLRAVLANWIARSRGVIGTPEQVVVTSGAGHAIDLIIRALAGPGDAVCVEEPGYPPVVNLLRTHGVEVVGSPVDQHGIIVDAIPDRTRIVYVTPSHQYPLGVVMSRSRRRELLQWAAQHAAAIIEDDYDTEFRRTSRPLEPLHLLDRDGRVIYVGTLAKSVSPALRVGLLVAPPSLIPAIRTVRQAIDWCPPALTDRALTAFIAGGHLDRHLRRARIIYRGRHKRVWDALGELLPAGYERIPSDAGLHITVTGPQTPSDAALALAVRAEDLNVGSLRRTYHFTPAVPGIVVGFGAIPDDRAVPAVQALRRALRAAVASSDLAAHSAL
jgi:GntR family transcriptional regulator / MocR family aminotransferase